MYIVVLNKTVVHKCLCLLQNQQTAVGRGGIIFINILFHCAHLSPDLSAVLGTKPTQPSVVT